MTETRARATKAFKKQAARLGYLNAEQEDVDHVGAGAVEARFITPQDPVIGTEDGSRLPTVPVEEALKLNQAKELMDGYDPTTAEDIVKRNNVRKAKDGTLHGIVPRDTTFTGDSQSADSTDAPLPDSIPPSSTNPLFPPVPLYGPPSLLRTLQCYTFRTTSAILSFCFLLTIILGAAFTSISLMCQHIGIRLKLQDPDKRRPFFEEEKRREQQRKDVEKDWADKARRRSTPNDSEETADEHDERFDPLEGGPDPLVTSISYYARRVGLDVEMFQVQTEDGFIINLYHIYVPGEYEPSRPEMRQHKSANVFRDGFVETGRRHGVTGQQYPDGRKKYPVLLMHGLLQHAGAYCCNDDESLAFFLAKSGYDVWIGNNRCGFKPEHIRLQYGDPRMWAWNIRQMGVLDLPALISRVLSETGFEKLGLICHSQGTTQTFVALAKEQRPDLGDKISVFCALAPAVYAGPLIDRAHFKIMQIISPRMFRIVFGIHAFIPFMMHMHSWLPPRFYGAMGYRVFAFLFNWTDDRWDRGLRNRMFQFAPVYVSAESMRWWLGRECFSKHKCILSTRREGMIEDDEDRQEDLTLDEEPSGSQDGTHQHQHNKSKGEFSWYDERAPPFAFWIAGNDNLVDGKRLLRRFERGREPHVNLVHSTVIPGYEHLDVIWAMDSTEKVGKGIRQVIWKTAPATAREVCRVPKGCGDVEAPKSSLKDTSPADMHEIEPAE